MGDSDRAAWRHCGIASKGEIAGRKYTRTDSIDCLVKYVILCKLYLYPVNMIELKVLSITIKIRSIRIANPVVFWVD